jgi:hypothetical protein
VTVDDQTISTPREPKRTRLPLVNDGVASDGVKAVAQADVDVDVQAVLPA